MQVVNFIDPKSYTLVIVPYYLSKYFKKLKYTYVPQVLFIKQIYKIYAKILQKVIYLRLFFKVKIYFKEPQKKDFIIFDKVASENLIYLLKKKNYFILANRLENIKKIYLSVKILLFCIKNYFKRSFRLNYLIMLTEIIKPKKVLTMIDNSTDFYIISNYFKKKIEFYAIQNANRVDMPRVYKNRFVNYYFTIGKFEKKILKNKKSILNLITAGALKAEIAKEYFQKYKQKITYNKYDVCLICDPHYFLGTYELFKQNEELIIDNIYTVADYALRFSKKFNKKIIFLGKNDIKNKLCKIEELFYKNFIKDNKFKITFNQKNIFENYKKIMESKIIIGYCSTMLREAFAFKKKVLCLDFANAKNVTFPTDGICLLEDKNYVLFEERVLEIMNMSYNNYLKKINNSELIYPKNTNTIELIKNKIYQNLRV
jgi:surface carbohydrate biosynthesis protein